MAGIRPAEMRRDPSHGLERRYIAVGLAGPGGTQRGLRDPGLRSIDAGEDPAPRRRDARPRQKGFRRPVDWRRGGFEDRGAR